MEQLKTSLAQWNISITERQMKDFSRYFELLSSWNKVMNLTAVTERNEVILKHFADSVALLRFYSLSHKEVIDLGTGAGFPGIPLKIVCPEIRLTLADSLQKRLRFLDTVIQELSLQEVSLVHGRAEDLGRNPDLRDRFDFCVSRAVANLSTLSEYCLPFVKPQGFFVAYKSEKTEEEIQAAHNAIQMLHGKHDHTEEYCLPGTDIVRTLVFIEKTDFTPKQFPRKAGKPSKDPL